MGETRIETREKAGLETQAEGIDGKGIVDEIVERWRSPDEDTEKQAVGAIDELVRRVSKGHIRKTDETLLNAMIADIDAKLTGQVNEILHNGEFQELESAWRGLNYLVSQSETGERIKIRAMNVSKEDLYDDLIKAPNFDQSGLFKQIYDEEYGVPGGKPYGAIVGNYAFDRRRQDTALLEKISSVAAAAHAPFIAAASPELFGWESFPERLPYQRDLSKIFEGKEYIPWRAFRESPNSNYVGLCLPRILLRLPYGEDTSSVKAFQFEEDVTGKDHNRYLWGNAAFAMGTRLTDAFSRFGWCAAIRGRNSGGAVEGLPVHTFKTDDGETAVKCPSEIAITDRKDRQLSELGFIPLSYYKDTDTACFFSASSTQKPEIYDEEDSTGNARLNANLPYIFALSRFAHYLKVIQRDQIGMAMEREEVEKGLKRWISSYVLMDDNASFEKKMKRPLREASVDVVPVAGHPGCYEATLRLRPHFQLEGLRVALRLVTRLDRPNKG